MSWNVNFRKVPGDPNHLQPVTAPTQKCSECDTALEPMWKDDPRRADTWFWTECEFCSEPICENCADATKEGLVCLSCLQTPRIRAVLAKVGG